MLIQSASCSSTAQQCFGADGTKAIGGRSRLFAAAQLERYVVGRSDEAVLQDCL
ncbi:MAG: hypothetical protein HC835_07945 [Oscillatoriales cyanobacterium RM2_1_1]|nr:hypothetical protein [Oscillatoriales cyanobacterium SM2_3_0]NJO45558.1 hypothetical protein [Oscillatoriales cyanobacterium RM2_1_1]